MWNQRQHSLNYSLGCNHFTSIDRYTASMGEPPRGTYYPASPGTGSQPPRLFQFNATNPWEREEREKVLKC